MKQKIYIFVGIISTILGIIGAFLPLMPTTPFLILASFLFARSSPKLNNLLLKNRLLGEYLTNYIEHRSLPLSSKIKTISLLWLGLLATIFFTNIPFYVQLILIFIGICVSLHIIFLEKFFYRKNTFNDSDTSVFYRHSALDAESPKNNEEIAEQARNDDRKNILLK